MEKPALDSITASIRCGVITGIVGPDAAGKTTLMRLMAGLLLPTHGSISILGSDTTKDTEAIHQTTGYMPQKFGLYEDLTVLENLTLFSKLQGLTEKEREVEIEHMLSFTSLKPFVNRLAGDLSGGMKQKLGLGCALLREPKVVLLDEPSVGIDPLSRRELWKIVEGLAKRGTAVVWSTSYLDEADRCDDVLLLNEGKLLFSGSPKDLTQRVQGRVFDLKVPVEERRRTLKQLLNDPDIVDGLIQGNQLRIVAKPSFKKKNSRWEATPPRFEDAFVDLLGGIPSGDSVLAAHISHKKQGKVAPIQAENLTKKFGDFTAANDISFAVKRGEILPEEK